MGEDRLALHLAVGAVGHEFYQEFAATAPVLGTLTRNRLPR
jgi:hypothetical protein